MLWKQCVWGVGSLKSTKPVKRLLEQPVQRQWWLRPEFLFFKYTIFLVTNNNCEKKHKSTHHIRAWFAEYLSTTNKTLFFIYHLLAMSSYLVPKLFPKFKAHMQTGNWNFLNIPYTRYPLKPRPPLLPNFIVSLIIFPILFVTKENKKIY